MPLALGQDPAAIDPAHYDVVLDNQWVRALAVHYSPGEGSPMHEHSAGVRVFVTDIQNRFTNPDGSTANSEHRAGDVTWAESVKHANKVVGRAHVLVVELELKNLPKRPAREAVLSGSPDRMQTVLIDNEFVRVLRADIPARRETRPFSHSKCLLITLTGGYISVLAQQGDSFQLGNSPGSVFWCAKGVYRLGNSSGAPMKVVVVELKDSTR